MMYTGIAIGVSGAIGVGKSSLSHALANRTGAVYVGFGRLVRSRAAECGLPQDREELQRLGENLLSSLGAEGLVDAALEHAGWNHGRSVVFDGVRHLEVWQAIETRFDSYKCCLVYLELEDHVRRSRLSAETEVKLEIYDSHSTERQVVHVIPSYCDYSLMASDDVDFLGDQVLKYLITQY